jgi:hypothetical protein
MFTLPYAYTGEPPENMHYVINPTDSGAAGSPAMGKYWRENPLIIQEVMGHLVVVA